jgi:prepilin-type N-terminal cleavage/methylation domain-containing protein/prepilin-type processing-associated H-X9-DG protein
MHLSKNKMQWGFTLIELLALIAVIGILAAILIPAIGKARRSAYSTQCVSNLRQLGVATHLYMQEYRGAFPVFSVGLLETGSNGIKRFGWHRRLYPYLGTNEALSHNHWWKEAVYRCPADEREGRILSYGFSLYLVDRRSLAVANNPIMMTDANGHFVHGGDGRYLFNHHDGGGNALFVDGSVRNFPEGIPSPMEDDTLWLVEE